MLTLSTLSSGSKENGGKKYAAYYSNDFATVKDAVDTGNKFLKNAIENDEHADLVRKYYPIPTTASGNKKLPKGIGVHHGDSFRVVMIKDGTVGEQEFQNTQDQLAAIFGVKRQTKGRTAQEVEDDELISEAAKAMGLGRGRNNTTKIESLIKVSFGLVQDIAKQLQNNCCSTCGHRFGISIAKGTGLPRFLSATFEHWLPDSFFSPSDIAGRNANTRDPRNKVTCNICNTAKNDYIKAVGSKEPLTTEQAQKLSEVAWKRYTILTTQEAYQRELSYLNQKYEIEKAA